MKLIKGQDGVYFATFATQKGTTGQVCLHSTDELEAKKLAKEIHIEELETVSSHVNLTHEVVTQIVAGKKVTIRDAVQNWFREATASRVLSPKTIHSNLGFLNSWIKEIGLENVSLSAVTHKEVSDYVNRGSEQRSSAVRKLSAIRSFFNYCQNVGYSYRNPASPSLVKVSYNVFKHEEKETGERGVFTEEECSTLIEAADPQFWKSAIIFATESGLRLGDIAQLEWASFRTGRMIVWTDKANKRVDLPINDRINEALSHISETDIRYLFPRERDIAIDPKRRALLSVQFSRLCRRVGILGRSFHCLRHTNATRLVESGNDLQSVATRLGHSSVETTKGYVHA